MPSQKLVKTTLLAAAVSALIATVSLALFCVLAWSPSIEGWGPLVEAWWTIRWQGVFVSILVSLSSVIVAARLGIRAPIFPLFFGTYVVVFTLFGCGMCAMIADFVTALARQGRTMPADIFFNANWAFIFVFEKWFIVFPGTLAVYSASRLRSPKPDIERLGCGQTHDDTAAAAQEQFDEPRAITQQTCSETDDGVMLKVRRNSTVDLEAEEPSPKPQG